jgi:hypothetical protein
VSPRRRAARRPAPSESGLTLVRRARELVPTLPTTKLRRVQELVERLLGEDQPAPGGLAELERLLED